MAKRSQIAVGQEWAYNRSRSHYIGDYGFEKVIIEAIEPHKQYGYQGINQVKKGLGVKVKYKVQWYGEPEPRWLSKVVQLSQLFIPWAEYEVQRAEYEAQRKIDIEKAAIVWAEREKFKEEVYKPAYAEFIDAVQAISGKRLSSLTEVGELPIEVIQAITEAIKEKAVV